MTYDYLGISPEDIMPSFGQPKGPLGQKTPMPMGRSMGPQQMMALMQMMQMLRGGGPMPMGQLPVSQPGMYRPEMGGLLGGLGGQGQNLSQIPNRFSRGLL